MCDFLSHVRSRLRSRRAGSRRGPSGPLGWTSTTALAVLAVLAASRPAGAQTDAPTVVDPNLTVQTVVTGLVTPISIAFLSWNDLLVLEKNTGRVQRVVNGAVESTVLDLAVNFASERGLLGIALHPDFPENPGVYLYWTESTTTADTSVLAQTPLLGNRVDRFTWNGSSLAFEHNLIRLRAIQADANQPARGNHNGGVVRFGPDGKLYIMIGDNGRRGQMQNLQNGPFDAGTPDDQFGGPEPDNAHLTGVILRLNDDGSAPADNPFFAVGAGMGGEVGANIQKVFAYGLRNGFGMAFDPRSGLLWEQENGDDSFSELNIVRPGFNSGWVQIMGPAARVAEFKATETSQASDPFVGGTYFGLQQVRWSPVNIADTPSEAVSRLVALPGSHFSDPEFAWRYEVAPGGIAFLSGRALGPQYDGDLFVGAARPALEGGHVFRFNLTGNRNQIGVDDPRLEDRVADNRFKFDITESESLLFGRNFGVVSDIQSGPTGRLVLVSLSRGAIYEIRPNDRRSRATGADR